MDEYTMTWSDAAREAAMAAALEAGTWAPARTACVTEPTHVAKAGRRATTAAWLRRLQAGFRPPRLARYDLEAEFA
jgi:hypothetical protein